MNIRAARCCRRRAGIRSLLRQGGAGGEEEAGKGAHQDMLHIHDQSLQNQEWRRASALFHAP